MIKTNYFKYFKNLNEKNRENLVDWLFKHLYDTSSLSSKVMYLTINIVDRYLEKYALMYEKQEPLHKKDFHRIGLAAYFIAGKFEAIYPPSVRKYVEYTKNAFRESEIIETEGKILEMLEFELNAPTVVKFLERYM